MALDLSKVGEREKLKKAARAALAALAGRVLPWLSPL